MKAIYRIPYLVSRPALLLLTLVSVAGAVAVERFHRSPGTPYHAEMLRASSLAARCMEVIGEEAARRQVPTDPRFDPTHSHMIGAWLTPVTSSYGSLGSKETTINPNFAALVVALLRQAGVREGEVVAVGYSGSFPALNACVCAALEVIKVEPVIIASAASSQWGANHPAFMWVDMETVLRQRGLISFGSIAGSVGGRFDLAWGMTAEGKKMLRDGISRNSLVLLEADTAETDLQQRMELYLKYARGRRIAAYVNVGGGFISLSPTEAAEPVAPGLILHLPTGEFQADSVAYRFSRQGVPVVNLSDVYILAPTYGLPWRPRDLPKAGEGGVYGSLRYSRPFAGTVLAAILGTASLVACLRRRAPV
jgi:poly-gamma-glutamate system protein